MTELITIAELIGKGSFCIPKYQRGYRWTQDEVEKLLNDIYEFSTDETNSSEYYCLQPIVVKKTEEGWYRIVDGQQRITTISLILGAIPVSENLQKDSKITIKYEVTDNDLDQYYKKEAEEVIKKWKNSEAKNKLKESLLYYTKVIWYELDKDEEEHKVFERLNVGKIPLTSAELIKAALLNSKNFTRDSELSKIQLALQWDEVEHTLQDDAFWCFLSNDTDKTSTRIDRIFELYYAETDSGRNIFEIFREKSGGGYQKEWNKIYNFFRRNVDLFNDPQAQGMMGFVYFNKKTKPKEIENIFFKKENNEELRTKEEIIVKLKNYCATNICNDNEIKNLSSEDSKKHIKEYIENLSYEKNKENINNILLLANIGKATFDGNKFPFDKYKIFKNNDKYEKINYDIEHISSQTENDLSNEKEKFIYLLSLLVAYSNEINRNNELDIESLRKDQIDNKEWASLSKLFKDYNIIKPEDLDIEKPEDLKKSDLKKIKDILNKNDICKKYIDDDGIDTDSIGNLVLLDSKTNRSYKNEVFVLKKNCIFKSKNFIPPLTMCAFMRVRVPDKNSENVKISSYVSQDVKWNKSDCELNKNNIINSIKNLLSDGKSK